MVKRFLCLILSILMLSSTVVFAEEEMVEEPFFLSHDSTNVSLEELAGKRLYVYGLIDSLSEDFLDVKPIDGLTRFEACNLI